jgi:ubiquinone/menaquinone biosynthesis C-methylase UbiE
MIAGEIFAEPLVELGDDDPRFVGILTPASAVGAAKVGVTDQFLERAEEYHRNYLSFEYWRVMLDRALHAAGDPPPPGTIIDIGSGSGNSVIPLAERFPRARIVATDISPQLLAILRGFLSGRPGGTDRFGLVCVDASAALYRESVADLAVGAAILHHVLDPSRVVAACHRALRPGGWAMFFEPFEAGNAIVKLTYQRVLAQATVAERGTPAMQFLARMVEDYVIRSRPRSDPVFMRLDDKWMFTRTYFERIAAEQGWTELITYPLNPSPTPLRDQAVVHLRLGAALAPDALPEWAWAVIGETDAGLSEDLKSEWLLEGAVLLRKRPAG